MGEEKTPLPLYIEGLKGSKGNPASQRKGEKEKEKEKEKERERERKRERKTKLEK